LDLIELTKTLNLLKMKIFTKTLILSFIGLLFFNQLKAQEKVITGTVIDAISGETLPGATIIITGTTIGAITDLDGNFTISFSEGDKLSVSFVGYLSQEIEIGSQTIIDIQLKPDLAELEEVVVVGYSTMRKSNLTGAISTVDAEELSKLPVVSVAHALQGQTAGVQITQSTGAPGDPISVRIRGTGTFGSNDPLYVIDGIPTTSSINSFSPGDIESIQIIKDASASAIYGARAANGVVLITTKGGKAGKTQINFDAYYGWQSVYNLPDMLNTEQFIMIQNESLNNTNAQREALGQRPLALNPDDPATLPDFDWLNSIFRVAPIQNYQVSLSGGSEKFTYHSSFNYFNQKGIILNSNYQRYTFRFNTQTNINTRLKIGNNLSLTYSDRDVIGNSGDGKRSGVPGIVRYALLRPSAIPLYDSEGNYTDLPDNQTFYGDAYNPVAFAENTDDVEKMNRLFGNLYVEYTILDNLIFRSTGGIDLRMNNQRKFNMTYGDFNRINQTNRLLIKPETNAEFTWNNVLNYSKSFNEIHNISALAGTEIVTSRLEKHEASRQNFQRQTPHYRYLDAGTGIQTNTESVSEWALLSYFGRFTYNFKGKYFLEGNLRRDASSRFGSENRWGTFPSASTGWIISREKFMENIKFIYHMKIRASWGQLGNQEIGDYPFVTPITQGIGYPFGTPSTANESFTIEKIGNDDIKWESTTQTNLGVDISLFEGQISTTFEYFVKKTSDILLKVPLPYLGGSAEPPYINAADVENKGIEFILTHKRVKGDFNYNFSVNFSAIDNVVTSLGGGEPIWGGNGNSGYLTKTEVGYPIGSFFLYEMDGIFQNEQEVLDHPVQTSNPLGSAPGDIRFKDLNNDQLINEEDRRHVGSPFPDFTYGLNALFSYKNVDISLFFQGIKGNDIYYYMGRIANDVVRPFNSTTEILDRWSGEGDNTSMPRVARIDANNNLRNSTRFLRDGSYLRLKNITIGYNMPAKVLDKLRMQTCRIYLSGQNLLTFSDYPGLDPEMGTSDNDFDAGDTAIGIDWGTYPQARTITVGVNFSF
jgi:TonB-linked SusC/RagA family outer membrane protein